MAIALNAQAAASSTAPVQLTSGPCAIYGYSFRETAGSAAVVTLRDGTLATSPILATVTLAANANVTVSLPVGQYINCKTALYLHRPSGTTEGCVYTGLAE